MQPYVSPIELTGVRNSHLCPQAAAHLGFNTKSVFKRTDNSRDPADSKFWFPETDGMGTSTAGLEAARRGPAKTSQQYVHG